MDAINICAHMDGFVTHYCCFFIHGVESFKFLAGINFGNHCGTKWSKTMWVPKHPAISLIGPLLGDGLKRGTPKALKGLPLSLRFCLSVCVSVCVSVNKLQVTVVDLATNFLDRSLMMGWSEELRKPLSLSFLFVCLSVCLFVCYQATDHSFRPSNLIFWKYIL